MNLLTFEDAIKASEHYNKRHLLLGNGFSIACRPNIFQYAKLFEQADFSALTASARDAFNRLKSTDFERVIKAIRDAAAVAAGYGLTPPQVEQMLADADALKELLV